MRVLTFAQALNEALREEMRRDESVVVLGQDVGRKGGVYLVTQGLLEEFGPERVVDTPLSESAIVGSAIGLALYGFRPVAEIQYADFIFGGFEQIVSNLATLRYRSGGDFTAPLVIRAPVGGWIRGGMYHSQSPEAYFAHTPGLFVVCPSNPHDAKGLLKAAIRSDDPVIFFEPKRLYWTLKGEVPEGEYVEQLGKARVVREGDDVTVVTFGSVVHEALEAARRAEERGISVEVIDLRTLKPLDLETVVRSVRKTGRIVVAHEAPFFAGYGAEVVAEVVEEAFLHLEAPPRRVAGFESPIPLAHETLYLPNSNRIFDAIVEVHSF